MLDEPAREIQIAELRTQVALLETAKAEAERATRKANLQLTILLLRLMSDQGICAVMLEDGRAWDFLSTEEFKRRYGRYPAGSIPTDAKPSRRKAA